MFSQVQKSAMPEDKVRFYIAELIVALEYIHMHGIVYRDIKLENIMLDVDGHVKLVDFGLCKKLGPSGRSKSFCGTEEYMAPEIVTCTGHNSAADWWALGVLAIELLSTVTPFGNSDGPNTTMEKITKEDPVMPSDISEEMEDFLLQLLNKDPNERLGKRIVFTSSSCVGIGPQFCFFQVAVSRQHRKSKSIDCLTTLTGRNWRKSSYRHRTLRPDRIHSTFKILVPNSPPCRTSIRRPSRSTIRL